MRIIAFSPDQTDQGSRPATVFYRARCIPTTAPAFMINSLACAAPPDPLGWHFGPCCALYRGSGRPMTHHVTNDTERTVTESTVTESTDPAALRSGKGPRDEN